MIGRNVIHHIALQVSHVGGANIEVCNQCGMTFEPTQLLGGLEFLHLHKFQYHSINSQNVLIWNMDPISIKLSDSGITHPTLDCSVCLTILGSSKFLVIPLSLSLPPLTSKLVVMPFHGQRGMIHLTFPSPQYCSPSWGSPPASNTAASSIKMYPFRVPSQTTPPCTARAVMSQLSWSYAVLQ